MVRNIIYIGNLVSVADQIVISDKFNLKGVISEKGKIGINEKSFFFTRNIPQIEVSNKRELSDAFTSFGNNCIYFMCGFGMILTSNMLKDRQVFNLHSGDLPEYKGRHPIFHAIVNNESKIYFSLHIVNEGIDSGNIVAKVPVDLPYDKGSKFVMKQIRPVTEDIIESLYDYLEGKIIAKKNVGGNYYPPVSLEDKTITPKNTISYMFNVIRAQDLFGAVIVNFNNKIWNVKKILISSNMNKNLLVDNNGYVFDKENRCLKGFFKDNVFLEFLFVENE